MDIRLKKAGKREVSAFNKKEWKKFYDNLGLEENFSEFFYRICSGEENIGGIKGWIYADVAVLDELIIKSEYRDRKIGHQVMEFFEKLARENKCRKMCIKTCPELMQNAFHLYMKHGFKVEAELKKDYFNKDWVILSKYIRGE